MKHGDRKGLVRGIMVTIMMGATFLIIQINEYVAPGLHAAGPGVRHDVLLR